MRSATAVSTARPLALQALSRQRIAWAGANLVRLRALGAGRSGRRAQALLWSSMGESAAWMKRRLGGSEATGTTAAKARPLVNGEQRGVPVCPSVSYQHGSSVWCCWKGNEGCGGG